MRSYQWRLEATRAAATGCAARRNWRQRDADRSDLGPGDTQPRGAARESLFQRGCDPRSERRPPPRCDLDRSDHRLEYRHQLDAAIVPLNTATFSNTNLTISSNTSINTIQFNAAAPAYSFTINPFTIFSINGAGISNSSAFAPTFTNNLGLMFFNSGTAANAAITNNGGISFLGSSSAGNSTIINNGGGPTLVSFSDTSTAGNATITTNGGAQTQFTSNSDGGNARFITNAGGTVDFSGSSGPLGDGNISAGSIEGAGTYQLGTNRLIVGSNNLSTTVSGSIQDSGNGSFTKTGAGTLTLTGTLNIGGDLSLCFCGSGGLTISGDQPRSAVSSRSTAARSPSPTAARCRPSTSSLRAT
jgi:hypothetical protein